MSIVSLCSRFFALVLAALLASCGGGGSTATPPTNGLVAVAGGSQVTLTWQADPTVQYWLLYALQGTPLDMSQPPGSHTWAINITSPYVVTGLTDGQVYAFAINGRVNGGKGGSQTPTVYSTPRPAGGTWTAAGTQGPTPGSLLGSNDMYAVTYGTATGALNYYMAVGSAGSIFTSMDAFTWTQSASTPSVNFKTAIYSRGTFIAGGTGDPANVNIYNSVDAVTWTAASANIPGGVNSFSSFGSTLVAVGNNGGIFNSTDGVNWNYCNVANPTSANLYSVAYVPALNIMVAVGAGGTVVTSPDGINWTVGASITGQTLRSVVGNSGGVILAVGTAGTLFSSVDGVNWTPQTLPGGVTPDLYAAAVDGVQYLVVGASGAVFTSPDIINWTNQSTSVTNANLYGLYGNSSFYIALGAAGTDITSQ